MSRFIPFFRIEYETKLTPKQVLERIQSKVLFYIIFSMLLILLARYAIKIADVMLAVMSILFVVMPYLSLLFKLHKSITVR